jgi:hypothetical protein
LSSTATSNFVIQDVGLNSSQYVGVCSQILTLELTACFWEHCFKFSNYTGLEASF